MLGRLLKSFSSNKVDRKPDVQIISFPKSGRTWHHLLVGNYLAREAKADLSRSMKVRKLCAELGKPTIGYFHNGANFDDNRLPSDPRVACPERWRNRNVLLIVRDLPDILTSAYFHARYRRKTYSEPISTFIRDPRTGAEKVLTAYNRWNENRKFASSFMVLSYEQLHANTQDCLIKTLEFAGHGAVNETNVAEAVLFCSAENMRAFEKQNYFKSPSLKPGKDKSEAGAKVRSARVGDHGNHLSLEDIAYIAEQERMLGNPFKSFVRS